MANGVKFIRVRGRVVPIKDKKETSSQKAVKGALKSGAGAGVGIAANAVREHLAKGTAGRKAAAFATVAGLGYGLYHGIKGGIEGVKARGENLSKKGAIKGIGANMKLGFKELGASVAGMALGVGAVGGTYMALKSGKPQGVLNSVKGFLKRGGRKSGSAVVTLSKKMYRTGV